MRDESEWLELSDNRFNVLVGADKNNILKTYADRKTLFATNYGIDLYGRGNASKMII